MKLIRTIRLDPSDTFVFERAAEPGEWAVSGAFAFWRSETNDWSSPNVAAVVADATRCRCSSMDSCPSASALSSTWQVSLRSLSFARVPGVCRVATSMIVGVSPDTRRA